MERKGESFVIHSEGIHHISIVVKDLEKAKAFYKEVLGLREIDRPDFDFPGAWFDVGSGQQLHLIVHSSSKTVRNSTELDTRDGHFALRVRNHRQMLEHLEQHRIPVINKTKSITGWIQVFCCDPSGNMIELNIDPEQEND
jgi:glyoxylase I family protein